MMHRLMPHFFAILTLLTLSLGAAIQPAAAQPPDQGDFVLMYGETQNADYAEIAQIFSESGLLDEVIYEFNELLVLPHDVPVVFGECGQANAFYNPEQSAIVLCYELIYEFLEVFMAGAQTEADFEAGGESVAGATLFIFFHELGHALVDLYQLPITGREEDAVDQLATFILVESGDPDIEASALDGAGFFAAGADQRPVGEDAFWGEHSLDAQRFYNILCWVFGSDPEGWMGMVEQGALPAQRAQRCPGEYEKLAGAWETLLDPFFKYDPSAY